jgi:hypothetical protein
VLLTTWADHDYLSLGEVSSCLIGRLITVVAIESGGVFFLAFCVLIFLEYEARNGVRGVKSVGGKERGTEKWSLSFSFKCSFPACFCS